MPWWLLSAWRWLTSKTGALLAALFGFLVLLSRAKRSGRLEERQRHEQASQEAEREVRQAASDGLDELAEQQADELGQVNDEIDQGQRDHFEDDW